MVSSGSSVPERRACVVQGPAISARGGATRTRGAYNHPAILKKITRFESLLHLQGRVNKLNFTFGHEFALLSFSFCRNISTIISVYFLVHIS